MVNIWSLIDRVVDTRCALCHAPGHAICADCLTALPRNTRPCAHCALPLPESAPTQTLCADCQAHPPAFDHVMAPLLYENPVDGLVAQFKYRQHLHLGRVLADTLGTEVRGQRAPPALLVPVPAGPRRLRERGFNQAAELARWLSAALDIPWSGSRLIRASDTPTQRGLPRPQRRRNIRGAFSCTGPLPDHLALIDDVMTTGATAGEASRALKGAGVKRVEVWAVARTPRDRWNRGSG